MNRAQRRKQKRGLCEFQPPRILMPKVMPPRLAQDAAPDFSSVPLTTVCESIWLLISELRDRGYPVHDFDHKSKSVQGIKIIRDKVYFLAVEEADDGEAHTGNEENGK